MTTPKPLTTEELAGFRKWVSGYNDPESLDLLAHIDHLQALYDAAWAECGAWRAHKALEHEEARLRREYPVGTCNAEDAWSDFGKSEEAANKAVKVARRHHDALRANKENT